MPDTTIVMMLEPEVIELANAHGPFSHGSWTGKGITIGNDGALGGRGAFLVSSICTGILKRFAPQDKIRVEMAKIFLATGNMAEAEKILPEITLRLNAYWRSAYRAFCLLAWTRRSKGDVAGAARYEGLCRLANPQFSMQVLKGTPSAFRPL